MAMGEQWGRGLVRQALPACESATSLAHSSSVHSSIFSLRRSGWPRTHDECSRVLSAQYAVGTMMSPSMGSLIV